MMRKGFRRIFALFLTFMTLFSVMPAVLVAGGNGEVQDVTLTFVINDSSYTNDPGSGNTHLTSPTEISGGDLTYTSWARQYKVTGTGTVCSYTIPAGTTLSQNGLSFPNLSVTNIVGSNTYEYSSVHSWVTESGMVCSQDTVFDEDTTLCLSLYTDSDMYNLDFICCEEHEASVGFYCGGKLSTFKLGNTVSEDHFYTHDEIVAHFPSTNHDTAHFAGWQLKNTQTGELIPFTPGMPITADYVDSENYGTSIKVYALFQETVTATFMNGENVVGTRTLDIGAALGELPDLSSAAPEGQIFLGWQTVDSENNPVFATSETVISEDTIYNAVFGEPDYFNIVFHDIAADGTESGSIEVSAETGTVIFEQELTNPSDGSDVNSCVWYTLSGTEKVPVDLSTLTVTQDLDLYTYSYEAQLTMPQNKVLNISSREGMPIPPAEFIKDGRDFSVYAWTYEDSSGNTQTLNPQDLMTNGLSENISATSDGTMNASGITPNDNHYVDFYVFLDGERHLVKSQKCTSYKIGSRYYLSAATLASVYGEYGFEASDLVAGTRYFPHVDYNKPNIWADTAVAQVGGVFYSPIVTSTGRVEVYYLPNQTLGPTNPTNRPWRDVLASGDENFYSVRVFDHASSVYTSENLPDPVYVLGGETVTVSVSNETIQPNATVTWSCVGVNDDTVIEGTITEDGTTVFEIPNIGQPFSITCVVSSDEKGVLYDINLPEESIDPEYATPTIGGEDTLRIYCGEDEDTHTVLAPSIMSYHFDAGEKYLGKATFLGWAVNGNTFEESLVHPGDVINLSDYGNFVSLDAQWHVDYASRQQKTGPMVNFFVSLAAHPDETPHWTGNIESAQFTESVYTDDCGVDAGIVPGKQLYQQHIHQGSQNQYFVLGDTSGDDINGRHDMIVEELTRGYTLRGNDGVDYTFQTSFPTDAIALRRIRQMIRNGTRIVINGHTVTEDEMNTENFAVRWYVFKYDVSDGWHIDGVLVSKVGTMVVNKTFNGDANAIEAIKNGDYSINVASEEGASHTGGTLTLDDAKDYDPDTNTYSWEVDIDQFYDYYLHENNYLYSENFTTTLAQYDIHNSKHDHNSEGLYTYTSDGITVSGQSNYYDESRKLQVDLFNTYTRPGTTVLKKIDAATGKGTSGIVFDIADEEGRPLYLYDLGNGNYELIPPNDGNAIETTEITTNSAGQAFLVLPAGTYKLTEHVPLGYEDPGVITIELVPGENGQGVEVGSAYAANGEEYVALRDGELELTVRNSTKHGSLTVEKIWTIEDTKPVAIQLYRNGEVVGAPVVLDGTVDTNEQTAWKYVYNDLPLCVDGELAIYSIRETRIGDFAYSQVYEGGYRYYNVEYSDIVYYDENNQPTTEYENAVSGYVSVTNSRKTGSLTVKKVDQDGVPLPGAVFRLYNTDSIEWDSAQLPTSSGSLYKTATSDENGSVDFGTVYDGHYYLVEYVAPEGYQPVETLFRIMTSNGVVTMEKWDSDNRAWVGVPDCRVVNRLGKTDVVIEKKVTGWMGDRSKLFQFTAVCSEPMEPGVGYTLSEDGLTATFSLCHDQGVTLKGVVKGSHLTISETNAEGYEMNISVGGVAMQGALTVAEGAQVLVNNQMDGRPDIGVILDTLPYVLILAAVAAVAVLLFIIKRRNKRRNRDDD